MKHEDVTDLESLLRRLAETLTQAGRDAELAAEIFAGWRSRRKRPEPVNGLAAELLEIEQHPFC